MLQNRRAYGPFSGKQKQHGDIDNERIDLIFGQVVTVGPITRTSSLSLAMQ